MSMQQPLREAAFQTPEGGRVRCGLCPHRCLIGEGAIGLCGVRRVESGRLYSSVYGHPCSLAVDPIEKKPLNHFMPGALTLSYATVGCNLTCNFCQNHSISQAPGGRFGARTVGPERLVAEAEQEGCRIIAHTYTEPTVYFEYAFDVAKLAAERGMHNVFVTNGFTSLEATRQVAPHLHGVNVDLKAFSEQTYREYCGGRLQPVLDTIQLMHDLGIWVEVTTLVVPGMNDSVEELTDIARFVASVSPSIPWHVSRFHPDYGLRDRGITSATSIQSAFEIGGREGLQHVFAGNLRAPEMENSHCSHCGQEVIVRNGFRVVRNVLKEGCCPGCGGRVAGVWADGLIILTA